MLLEQYLFKDIVYSIYNCTKQDIPSHIEKVYQYWSNGDIKVNMDKQYKLLEQSVEDELAFKLVDSNDNVCALLYAIIKEPQYANIYLFWGSRKPFIAMITTYGFCNYAVTARFYPHYINHFPYEFLINDISIRSWRAYKTPIEVTPYSEEYKKFIKLNYTNKKIKQLKV